MRRMSLAEQVQLSRADEQMERPARELLFDTAFQRRCSDGYWRGKLAKAHNPDLWQGQLTLFKMEPDGKEQDRPEVQRPRCRRARVQGVRAGEGSGWLMGLEDAARAG